jgi:hypothetical protein
VQRSAGPLAPFTGSGIAPARLRATTSLFSRSASVALPGPRRRTSGADGLRFAGGPPASAAEVVRGCSPSAIAASLRIPFLATPAAPSAGAPVALDPRVSKPDDVGSALQTQLGAAELAHSGVSVFVPAPAAPSRAAVTAASPRGGLSPQGLTVDPAQNPLPSAGVDAVHPVDITAAVAVSPSSSAGASGTTTGLPSLAYPTPFSAVAVSAHDPSPRASLASAAVRWCGGEGSGRPLTGHLPPKSALRILASHTKASTIHRSTTTTKENTK